MHNINDLSTFKALEQSRLQRNAGALDHFLRADPAVAEQLGLKRIQFETHPALAEQLDEICSLLHVSKREFLESALVDAITQAESRFREVFRQSAGYEFGERPEVDSDGEAA